MNYKKYLFFLLPLFIFFILLIQMIIIKNIKKPTSSTPFPTVTNVPYPTVIPGKKNEVLKIIPDSSVTLTPGRVQDFLIYFRDPINSNLIKVVLNRINVSINEPPVPVKTQNSIKDQKTLRIETIETIKENNEYDLIIQNSQGETIFKKGFLSGQIPPSPVKNNRSLIPYLPHETSNYKIVFNSSRNIYIFNFKYDPNSPYDIETQYENAKRDAINYIQSKGIDISSITVEWRSS